MLKPFFVPFILAVVLAQSCYFIYARLLKWTGNREILSSLLTCFLVAVVIVIPLSFIIYSVVGEVQGIMGNFSATKNNVSHFVNVLNSSKFFQTLGVGSVINQETVSSLVRNFFQNSLAIFTGIYSGLASFIFTVFIMFFSLFYLFMDGKKLIKKLMQLSPLKDSYEKTLIHKFNSITYGVIVKGTFLIALIQGTIGAILFWATGVPSPILLGILMAVASIIPYVGTGFIWIPVGIIMLIFGQLVPGLIILLLGASIIASVDNILSPKLIGKDSQMHPLLILLSTLGGIVYFGATGFIIGPIVMSFFVVLWDIYSLEFKTQLEEYN
jgi:predicted PurR-regulated permease PerM